MILYILIGIILVGTIIEAVLTIMIEHIKEKTKIKL